MKKFFIIFSIFTMVLLNSCKTYDIFTITVLEPAEIALPMNLKKLVIAHNLFRTPNDTAGTFYSLFDQLKQDTTYLYEEIATEAMYSLQDILNASGRFEAIVGDSVRNQFPKLADDFTMNDLEIIRKICKDKDAAAFVLLNSLSTFDKYDVMVDRYGSYFGEFEVIINASWLFIDPFSAKLTDTKMMTDTLFFQTDPWYFNENVLEFPFRKDVLLKSGGEAGIAYGKRISPYWTETKRLIFKSGSKEIRKGYKLSQQKKWPEASIYWQNALNNPEEINQAKAAFNLGLASEMDGLLQPAANWVQKSIEIMPDTINKIYLQILENRLQQQDDIYFQMEGINK